jgi:hypothetical protein
MAPPPSKLGTTRKIGIVKIARSKAKPGPQGTSEIELVLARPVGVSNKFCLLNVVALSHRIYGTGHGMTHGERVARAPAIENLGDDSSPDVHKTPSPKRVGGKRASPPPSSPGEFL